MRESTCCFSGHRILPEVQVPALYARLCEEIDRLCARGVTDFISGGALGFDQLAAEAVIDRRAAGLGIRLMLALPCADQAARWTRAQKLRYRALLDASDEQAYVSLKYEDGCMAKRNRYMVDRSAHLICYLTRRTGGTWRTTLYARRAGLNIITL